MCSASWRVDNHPEYPVYLISGICLMAMLVGCAATVARIDTEAPTAAILRLYPESTYISYLAVSGNSRLEAETIARREVSAQISSRIEAQTSLIAHEIASSDTLHTSSEWTSIIRTRTGFEHAELIRLAPNIPARNKGVYQAFAYIARAELYQTLEIEYREHTAVFAENIRRLPELQGNLPAYTTGFASLRDAYVGMAAAAAMIQAVTRSPYAPFSAAHDAMGTAESARRALLRDLRLALRVDDAPDLQGDLIAGVIRAALAQMGIGTLGDDCSQQGYALRLLPEITWSRIMGVRICTLRLKGALTSCDGSVVLKEIVIDDRKKLGGDGRDPIARLLQRLTPELMTPFLEEQLRGVVPIAQK